jgi:Skp family chaperone for outer membrane proteins
MKKLSLIVISLAAVILLAADSFAQGAPPASGKIGLISISAFGDEKAGITKYKNAAALVDKTLEPINNELKALATRYQTATTDLQNMQKNPATKPDVLSAKVDEVRNLETTIKRKQEDGKAFYNKIYSETMSPVMNDIFKALNEYAKQKGYAVILDGAKLEQADILLGFDDRYDVTKDFIVFYNARPAGTATNVTPK